MAGWRRSIHADASRYRPRHSAVWDPGGTVRFGGQARLGRDAMRAPATTLGRGGMGGASSAGRKRQAGRDLSGGGAGCLAHRVPWVQGSQGSDGRTRGEAAHRRGTRSRAWQLARCSTGERGLRQVGSRPRCAARRARGDRREDFVNPPARRPPTERGTARRLDPCAVALPVRAETRPVSAATRLTTTRCQCYARVPRRVGDRMAPGGVR